MRVDLYHRPEYDHKFSFLAVPEGQVIPEEVTNTDWERHASGIAWDDSAQLIEDYGISGFAEQIEQKGYAITGIQQLVKLEVTR